MRVQRIPPATVARLPIYVQGLKMLAREGVARVSSRQLAEATGIDAPQIRRDLSYLGAFGTPGVGYHVAELLREISAHLGLSRTQRVVLVGCSQLGSALAGYAGLPDDAFRIVAVFDGNPEMVGTRVAGQEVLPLARLPEVAADPGIDIAIIATGPGSAQGVAEQLMAAGVASILNFAPVAVAPPEGVAVRNIDLAAELQILSFHQALKSATPSVPPTSETGSGRGAVGSRGGP